MACPPGLRSAVQAFQRPVHSGGRSKSRGIFTVIRWIAPSLARMESLLERPRRVPSNTGSEPSLRVTMTDGLSAIT